MLEGEEKVDKLLEIISVHVFGYDDIHLEQVLGNELQKRNLTVAIAEGDVGTIIADDVARVEDAAVQIAGQVLQRWAAVANMAAIDDEPLWQRGRQREPFITQDGEQARTEHAGQGEGVEQILTAPLGELPALALSTRAVGSVFWAHAQGAKACQRRTLCLLSPSASGGRGTRRPGELGSTVPFTSSPLNLQIR